MAFWKRKPESRALPPAENQLPLVGAYTSSTITPTAALAIGDVWAAVRVLADAVSSLPLHVYRKAPAGRERVGSGSLVELLDHPGPGTTQADLVSSLMAHLLVHGNGYVAKFREGDQIVQIGLIHPERIRPELDRGQLRFRYSPPRGAQQLLTTSDVVHVKGLSTDGLLGLSAVSQASRVLGLSDELVKHAISFFQNAGAGPAGVFTLPDGTPYESGERFLEAVQERFAGTEQAHNFAVLMGADYTPVQVNPDDAQFHEQRELAAREVARVFRIPPHMLGAPTGDSLTYSTVEQESINFVRYSLTPWLRRIELAISGDRDLAFERQFVKFEVDGLLRADASTRSEVYARALDPISGWLTRDEVRALEDLSPMPEPTSNGNATPTNLEAMIANVNSQT